MLQSNNFEPKCRGSPSDWGLSSKDNFGGMGLAQSDKEERDGRDERREESQIWFEH